MALLQPKVWTPHLRARNPTSAAPLNTSLPFGCKAIFSPALRALRCLRGRASKAHALKRHWNGAGRKRTLWNERIGTLPWGREAQR